MFVKLLLSILLPLKTEANKPPEYEDINSVIKPKTPVKNTAPTTNPSLPACPLTANQILENIVQAYDDCIDCLYLHCLPAFGCIHCRSEWCMATGDLQRPSHNDLPPCKNQCHVCDKTYQKTFLFVVYSNAITFLKSSCFNDLSPKKAGACSINVSMSGVSTIGLRWYLNSVNYDCNPARHDSSISSIKATTFFCLNRPPSNVFFSFSNFFICLVRMVVFLCRYEL